jgi:hypothetical protein
MESTTEIVLSIFVGLGVTCAMVLALGEEAVRFRDVLVTVSAGIAGAVLGSGTVQLLHMAEDNLHVIGAAATTVGGLAAAFAEIATTAGRMMAAAKAANVGKEMKIASASSMLIDKTIVRLHEPQRSRNRAIDR